jgi:hypothetical protein
MVLPVFRFQFSLQGRKQDGHTLHFCYELIIILSPVNDAGATQRRLLLSLQVLIVAETIPAALLGRFVPEIAALLDAVTHLGQGTEGAVVQHIAPKPLYFAQAGKPAPPTEN